MLFELELFPRLPVAWINYCVRVQGAHSRIQNVLEDRSQTGVSSLYVGECIVIERGVGILNQFIKRHTRLLKLEVTQLKTRIRDCRLEEVLLRDSEASLKLSCEPSLATLLQIDYLLKSIGFDGKSSPTAKLAYIHYMCAITEDWQELLEALEAPSAPTKNVAPSRHVEGSKRPEEVVGLLKATIHDATKCREYVECLQRAWLSLSCTHYTIAKCLQARPPRPIAPNSSEWIIIHHLKSIVEILGTVAYPDSFMGNQNAGELAGVSSDEMVQFYKSLKEPLRMLNDYRGRLAINIDDGNSIFDENIDYEVVAPWYLEVLRYTESIEDDVPFVDLERTGVCGIADCRVDKVHIMKEWKRFVSGIEKHKGKVLEWVISRKGIVTLNEYTRSGTAGSIGDNK